MTQLHREPALKATFTQAAETGALKVVPTT
jgi:hypothetical protein